MGLYNSRRMAEDDSTTSYGSGSDMDSDQESEQDYRQILHSLITRYLGEFSSHVHIMTPPAYLNPRIPKIEYKPNTSILDASQYSILTKQACGLSLTTRKLFNRQSNVSQMLLNREKGMYKNTTFSYSRKCKITNKYLPNSIKKLDTCSGKVFCGIFSKDGNYFMTASQDRNIRLYNSGDGSYRLFNSLRARDVGWSIIDVNFSPDKEHFVYSTWSSALHLCSIKGNTEHQEPLCLLNTARRFCVFSVVFSSDGKELLSGANDGCLYIYDLQRHERTQKINAHEYDVNSVVFADDSSDIIYSGGDDGLIKVWDRRTLSEYTPKPVGILAGHMDGITFIDSRGDGRHLISNSKDQSIKLWDVRVFSSETAAEKSLKAVDDQNWDYRWQEVPQKLYAPRTKLEGDTSIMTYRGHVVIKTLVRCRFSPAETTGQRYIYTGCGLGSVIVYDSLTGKVKQNVNGHVMCVRDVSWHPTRNEILSSSWDCKIGKWTYVDKEIKSEELKSSMAPVRRSLRLALKNRRERR